MDPVNAQGLPVALITYALPDSWMAALDGKVEAIVAPLEARGFSAALWAKLAQAGHSPTDVRGILTLLTEAVDPALLDRFPNLKVVSNMAVGVDNIDLNACNQRGIPVGNTTGVLTAATADMAIALLLASSRRLAETSLDAAQGRWASWIPDQWLGTDLDDSTVGVIGMGKIGLAIASRAKAFGSNIIYHNRSRRPEAEQALGARYRSFEELLAEADYVILAVSLSDSTRALIDCSAMRKMKSTATLINIARGPVVASDDLVAALKSGQIRAAALDVTDPEPLPPAHPLYTLPNCLITPHIGSATENTRRAMAQRACNNLLAGLNDEPLEFCVNPNVYDSQTG